MDAITSEESSSVIVYATEIAAISIFHTKFSALNESDMSDINSSTALPHQTKLSNMRTDSFTHTIYVIAICDYVFYSNLEKRADGLSYAADTNYHFYFYFCLFLPISLNVDL